MQIRKKLIYTMMILGATTMPAAARTDIDLIINTAPPPARYEAVPQVDYGYVWAPGYWSYSHGHRVWVRGHQIENRPGYAWQPDHWEQHGKKWQLARGNWQRDENYYEHDSRRDHDNRHGYNNDRANYDHKDEYDHRSRRDRD